jgi:hypothetical protein
MVIVSWVYGLFEYSEKKLFKNASSLFAKGEKKLKRIVILIIPIADKKSEIWCKKKRFFGNIFFLQRGRRH